VATVGGVAVGTGIASAGTSSCTSNGERGLCLAIDGVGGGRFSVHVGVDVHMSVADAQEYIDDPGDPFDVIIVGDDGSGSDPHRVTPGDPFLPILFRIPMTYASAGSPRGLSASFDAIVPGRALDEDPAGQEDEIRAYLQLWDRDTNRITNVFLTNQLSGRWP